MAVSIAERAGTLWLTLLRPPVNAIDLEMVESVTRIVEETKPDHPIVLTGKGKSFSAGIDTTVFAAYSKDQRRDMVLGITRMVRALVCHPAPVVAAINGHALGGGLVLALTADYRVAGAPDAKFGLTEAKAGVPFPIGAVEVIRHEIPAPLLRNLTLTSRIVDQDALLEAGLIDQISQPDNVLIAASQALHVLKGQPGFQAVKRQVRGLLQARLTALVEKGNDPFLKAFGAA
ncbi:enoyl-CoA hydratase/isomerase family protein [Henriciella sp.]|uniref:enoyl-CoA hydratase/isomerase family protein n=1 Tax=Henriciella sp. TaxID=1968823 RepID=UPI0026239185|nr:enoyl-CoA hydratase/isomerase family protein [Henriciella sp.]